MTNAERQKQFRDKRRKIGAPNQEVPTTTTTTEQTTEKPNTIFYTVEVPTSPGLKRNKKDLLVIDHTDAIISDEQPRIIIQVWASAAHSYIEKLTETTLALGKTVNWAKEETLTNRGLEHTLHFGSWRKYRAEIEITEATTKYKGEEWIKANNALFAKCGTLFYQFSKPLYLKYSSLKAPLKLADIWTTCAINFNWGAMNCHKDKHDYRHGLCFVVPFGDFTGGELYFPTLNIMIKMYPGIVVAFRSFEFKHTVLAYEGARYSVVLFSPQDNFFPCL